MENKCKKYFYDNWDKYPQYKGIYYFYNCLDNIWVLYDGNPCMSNICNFNANNYRIDECINFFKINTSIRDVQSKREYTESPLLRFICTGIVDKIIINL